MDRREEGSGVALSLWAWPGVLTRTHHAGLFRADLQTPATAPRSCPAGMATGLHSPLGPRGSAPSASLSSLELPKELKALEIVLSGEECLVMVSHPP